MIAEKSVKIRKTFECKLCDYITSDKKDYSKHLSTRKHKMVINGNKMVIENPQNPENDFNCICGKSYKHESGYYRHKKTCTFIEEKEENAITQNSGGVDNEIVMQLVKSQTYMVKTQNDLEKNQNDFQNFVVKEIIPKIGNTNTITNCN